MYIPLILALVIITAFLFLFFKKDLLSPSFLLSLSFLVSAISAALAKVFGWWNDTNLGLTVSSVIIVGLLAAAAGEFLVRRIFAKKSKEADRKTRIKMINIGVAKIVFIYLFIIASLIIIVKQMMDITGITNNIPQMINKYRDLTPLFNADSGNISISTFAMQLVRVTNVLGIVSLYVMTNNLMAGDRAKNNMKYFGIVILALITMFLVGGRANMVQYVFAGIAFLSILRRKYIGVKAMSKRAKVTLVACGVSMLFGFYLVMPLIGRNQVGGMSSYISFYMGNSIAAFQKVLDEDKKVEGRYFGESFLGGVQQALNKFGLYDDYSAYQNVWVHYKSDTGKTMASNTFTGVEPYYNDGGFVGVVICQLVYGILFTSLYLVAVNRSAKFWTIFYGFIFVNLFYHMRSESVFSLVSISTILYIVYMLIVIVFILPMSEERAKDLRRLKEMLLGLRLGEIIKRLINRRRIARLSHSESENNFVPLNSHEIVKKAPRIVVYTCITGNYDNLSTVKDKKKGIDYLAFLDNMSGYGCKNNNWEIKKIQKVNEIDKKFRNKEKANIMMNRYLKFHPYEMFSKEYDYAIYVDGNIDIVGDLSPLACATGAKTGLALHRHRQRDSIYNEAKVCEILKKGNIERLRQQIDRYKSSGFPEDFGLYECNVIVTDLRNKNGKKLLDCWWKEFVKSESMRDQIALPFVVWRNGYRFDEIGFLGNNVFRNPLFSIHEEIHKDKAK